MSLIFVGAAVVLSTLAGAIASGVAYAERVETMTSVQAGVTPSAQDVIDEFFRARLGANGKQGDAAVAPRISAALAALWKEHDRLCDELHEGPCRLDEMYDIWLGTQEYGEGLTYESSGYVSTALSDNRVHVSFDLFPLDTTQKTKGRYERQSVFLMVQENGHWVVDDMDRVGANTIRQYMEKDNADIALDLAKREMEALQPLKRKMIDAFYRRHLDSWSSPGRPDEPMMSASLQLLVSENKRLCAELNDGICGWEHGAVPWVSAQDVGDGLTFDTAGYLSYDMPDDHVRVRFNICPLALDPQRRVNCERTYEFAMILENGKWVVNDLFRPDDLSARRTLEADNKKMAENLKAAGEMHNAIGAGEKH